MDGLIRIRTMNDSQIQVWLRNVGYENAGKLGMALLDAGEEVQQVVFRNMSERAAGVLREDIKRYISDRPDDRIIAGCVSDLEKMF